MIKNIIFDVGKVLVEWDCDTAFRKLGFDETTLQAVAEATVRSADWNEFDRSVLNDEQQLALFIKKAPEYEKEIRLFWENIALPIYQYDYARAWIKALKRNGYHIYILSNYSRWTYEHTREALSFLEDVDGTVFSFEVHQIKPEPEIYQSLLKRYQLKPSECVFLDDRLENLDAAREQGINVIQFESYGQAVQELAGYGVTI